MPPRDKIAAKFKGDATGAYLNGVPARDIHEAEFSAFSDEQKAAVSASPLYTLRHDAPEEATAASKRVAPAEVDAPKAEVKK